jgi:hypothetical protein
MDNYILQQIKAKVEGVGYCKVTRSTLELLAEAPFADTDALLAAMDQLMAAKAWITSYDVDHIQQDVTFHGPIVAPPPA